jgi:tetratricopeptide (TPR) repeat protein
VGVTAAIVYFVMLSQWYGYGGGHCWGPRLLMPVLPLLILLAGGALETRWMRWIGGLLLMTGIAVNSLGALINYQSYYITAKSAKKDYSPRDPVFNQIRCQFWLFRVQTKALLSGVLESDLPLWKSPPWIGQYPDAIPPPYSRTDQPIFNSWPLRLTLAESRWKREENWYLRALMEVAIFKYEQGDMPGAMKLIDEGLKLDPDYKDLIAAKGLVYYSVKDTKRALQQFGRSLILDPDFELGLYGVGLVMEELGNPRDAYFAYMRLLKLPLKRLERDEIVARIKGLTPR